MKVVRMFYDVETTGLDYKKSSIVQLSGIIEVNGAVKESFNFRIRPHEKAVIEPEALSTTGLTEEEIWKYPHMKDVYQEFTSILSKYVNKFDKTDKIHLVGFNNRQFDDQFLRMFFELCGDKYFGSWFWVDSLDVLVLASPHLIEVRHTMPSFKLSRVAKQLGIQVEEGKLHDALYDVELTRQIYLIVTDNLL